MNSLVIIGLGLKEGDLTLNGLNEINKSQKLVVRTNKTLSYNNIKDMGKEIVSLDYVYEKSRNFNTLNANLCKEIINILKTKSVTYLVDGSAVEDSSVQLLLKKVKNAKVIAGVSAKESALERLKISKTNCHTISAYDILSKEEFSLPLVVYAIDSKKIASEIKLILSNLIGDEVDIYLTSNKITKKIKLFELDRQIEYDYSTSIFIDSEVLTKKQRFNFNDLLKILEILRGENGCPWDKVQTPKSIEKNLIEETYELLDAIELDDDDKIIEEAGDVLLQVAFYILFGEESLRYNREDVLTNICSKLITRHTHVFGNDTANSGEEALKTWNKNKAIEKGYQNGYEYIDSVPHNLPSVMRAQKVGSRAQKYNFDFNSVEETFSKIIEEIEEIKTAIKSGNFEEIESECGDLLFSAVNTVRKLGVDGETALIRATNKFINRFKLLEEEVINSGKDMKNLTLEELDKIYENVKHRGENGN